MLDKQLATLFSFDAFQRMAKNEQLNQYQINMIFNSLMTLDIPFDVSFVSGTRKGAQSLQLTIHLNPSSTLVYVITLEPGASVFSPSP